MRLLVPLMLLMSPLALAAEKKAPKGVDVALVSENRQIAPGQPFRVGLKIHHHPKYHTYWQNPGIAGVPTQLNWKLPEGFSAGAIRWPFPEKTLMAVHPVYGYERDVLLMVDIQPPAEIHDTKVTLQATASWMACAEGCYPGKVELEVTLPVAANPELDSEMKQAFAQSDAEIPSGLEKWSIEVVSAPDAPEIQFRLKPHEASQKLPEDLHFFSSDGQVSSNRPQRVETTPDGALLLTAERSEQSPKGKTSLPGVLAASVSLAKEGRTFAAIDPKFPSGL
jgi:DsbC/DsbD-like thiol-disulfide interchange protein